MPGIVFGISGKTKNFILNKRAVRETALQSADFVSAHFYLVIKWDKNTKYLAFKDIKLEFHGRFGLIVEKKQTPSLEMGFVISLKSRFANGSFFYLFPIVMAITALAVCSRFSAS